MKNKLDSNEQIIENEAESYRKVSDQTKKKIESILAKSSKKKVITLRLNDDDLIQIKTIANILWPEPEMTLSLYYSNLHSAANFDIALKKNTRAYK